MIMNSPQFQVASGSLDIQHVCTHFSFNMLHPNTLFALSTRPAHSHVTNYIVSRERDIGVVLGKG